jgi:hypothetical protein
MKLYEFSIVLAIALPPTMGFTVMACTPAQAANDVSIALTDTQQACAITEAATAASPLAVDLPEVEAACGIATGLETGLKAFLYDFFAMPPAAKADLVAKAKIRMSVKSDAGK